MSTLASFVRIIALLMITGALLGGCQRKVKVKLKVRTADAGLTATTSTKAP